MKNNIDNREINKKKNNTTKMLLHYYDITTDMPFYMDLIKSKLQHYKCNIINTKSTH